MERSWLKKDKRHSDTSYAIKNLSLGLLMVGKGSVASGQWALNLTEWEVSKRGFLANPKTDKWLCVTMSEYQEMLAEDAKKLGEVIADAFVEKLDELVDEAKPELVEEVTPEPEPTPEPPKKKKRRGRPKKKAKESAE